MNNSYMRFLNQNNTNMDNIQKHFSVVALCAMLLFFSVFVSFGQNAIYTCDFEDNTENANWTLENGSQINQWHIGTAASNGGSNGLYITNDGGANNAYDNTATSYVYAYRTLNVDEDGYYTVNFDWQTNGEGSYDYLRAFIVPASASPDFSAGTAIEGSTTVPDGWIDIANGELSMGGYEWHNSDNIVALDATTYHLVFYWKNSNSGNGYQPPAAVDNISITKVSCVAVTSITATDITGESATISWTERGSAENWEIVVSATELDVTALENNENIVSVTSPSYSATSLTKRTTYYVYVRAVCSTDDKSDWQSATFSSAGLLTLYPDSRTSTSLNMKAKMFSIAASGRSITFSSGRVGGIINSYSNSASINGNILLNQKDGLSPETEYYYTVSASNDFGIFKSDTLRVTTCGTMTDDRDGTQYNTIKIGEQVWMAENLRYEGSIPLSTSTNSTYSSTDPYRYYPTGGEEKVQTYGYLYNLPAAMNGASGSNANPSGVQGICPEGWHLPSKAEWDELENHLNSENAGAMLAGKYRLWGDDALTQSYYFGASGFDALPAGYVTEGNNYNGGNYENADGAYFWSSNVLNGGESATCANVYSYAVYFRNDGSGQTASTGNSVRCVKSLSPTVATNWATGITTSSATLNAHINNLGDATVSVRGFMFGTDMDELTQNLTSSDNTTDFTYTIEDLSPSTIYYFKAYITIGAETIYGEINTFNTLAGLLAGHGYVDLGLPSGTYWATCNVGATTIEGLGNYYAWGETAPKPRYTSDNYTYDAYSDILPLSDDAAAVNWGDGWRMPTDEEMVELYDNCDYTFTIWNDTVRGLLLTSRINGNTIFLPAAGNGFEDYTTASQYECELFYWTSSIADYPQAYALYYYRPYDNLNAETLFNRYQGQSVRAVFKDIPTVETKSATDVTPTTATLHGKILFTENATVTNRGFSFGTDSDDLTQDFTSTDNTNVFTYSLTGLAPNTTYYFQAYATIDDEIIYGDLMSFTTVDYVYLYTRPVEIKNAYSALLSADINIYDFNEQHISEKGFHYGMNSDNLDMTLSGNFIKTFEMFGLAEELSPSTNYFYKPYIIYDGITYEGDLMEFTTDMESVITNVTTVEAEVNGRNVTLHGAVDDISSVSDYGFYYGDRDYSHDLPHQQPVAIEEPTFSFMHTVDNETGIYFYRAYAMVGGETVYGNVRYFAVEEGSTVSTDSASNITYTTATLHGSVSGNGSSEATGRGFWYSFNGQNYEELASTDVSDNFTYTLTGLLMFSSYYYKAYVVFEDDTIYGDVKTFSTLDPNIITEDASNVTYTAATLRGSVSGSELSEFTGRGFWFYYRNNQPYVTLESIDNSDNFSYRITGLRAGISYYYEAYVAIDDDTIWGEGVYLLTDFPNVFADSASNITFTTATLHGSVSGSGNSEITGRGFLYSTDDETYLTVESTDNSDNFTALLTGLEPNTSYYYQAYVVIGDDTIDGENVEIFTTFGPPEATIYPLAWRDTTSVALRAKFEFTGDSYSRRLYLGTNRNNLSETDSEETYNEEDSTFTIAVYGLSPESQYYATVEVSNASGTTRSDTISFNTNGYFFDDRDDTKYYTITIGDQTWTAENIRYLGDDITLSSTDTSSTVAYCYMPSFDESTVAIYGYVYNWAAAMGGESGSDANPSGVKGICPTGWHLPSDAEWQQLAEAIGGTEGTSPVLAARNDLWNFSVYRPGIKDSPYWGATGFDALPAGSHNYTSHFGINTQAYFWSSTEIDEYQAYCSMLYAYDQDFTVSDSTAKQSGYSVRCVRNEGATALTFAATGVTHEEATIHGSVYNNVNSVITERGFEYGTRSTNLAENIVSTNETTDFAAVLTGLSAGTVYYYRAYITIDGERKYGTIRTFKTIGPPEARMYVPVWRDTTSVGLKAKLIFENPVGLDAYRFYIGIDRNSLSEVDNDASYNGEDSTISVSAYGLLPHTLHWAMAEVENEYGTKRSDTISFYTYGHFYDARDNNDYRTIKIGDQTWMVENLRYEGDIPLGTCGIDDNTTSTTDPYRYYPDEDVTDVSTYGYLYNRPATMNGASSGSANPSGVQGLCPDGWHLPSVAEWDQLRDYLGDNRNAAIMLAGGASLWRSDNILTSSEQFGSTGFNALPVGTRTNGCLGLGLYADFWTTNLQTGTNAYYEQIKYSSTVLVKLSCNFSEAKSIRCLKVTSFYAYDTVSTCDDSYTFYSQTITESGDYTHTINIDEYIDSVYKLHITFLEIPVATISDFSNGCFGQNNGHATVSVEGGAEPYNYVWNTPESQTGATLNNLSEGEYSVIVTDANGCSAASSVEITAPEEIIVSATDTACNSYEWNGITYTETGEYTQTLLTAEGCDSVVTLHLIINHSSIGEFADQMCPEIPYIYEGETFTEAGTYEVTLTNSVGCDSIVTLTLTYSNDCNGTVSGVITDASTNLAIQNAKVTIGNNVAWTNSNGEYSLTIPHGQKSFRAAASGYVSYSGIIYVLQDTTIDIALYSPHIYTDIDSIAITTYPYLEQTDTLTISNTGNTTLVWSSITEYDNIALIQDSVIQQRSNTRSLWDSIQTFATRENAEQAIATDGFFIYTSSWMRPGEFNRYTPNGEYVETFYVENVGSIRNLSYDGTYFYGTEGTNIIFKLDLDNQTLVDSIETDIQEIRHCSFNRQDGSLLAGSWNSLYSIDTATGVSTQIRDDLMNIYSSAYDNLSPGGPYLWLFSQTSQNNGPSACIRQFSISTGEYTGRTHYLDDINLSGTSLAGGICASEYVCEGKFVLLADVQNPTGSNTIAIYEIGRTNNLTTVETKSGSILPNENLKIPVHGLATETGDFSATIRYRAAIMGRQSNDINVTISAIAPECDAVQQISIATDTFRTITLDWQPVELGNYESVSYLVFNTASQYAIDTVSGTTVTYGGLPAGEHCFSVMALSQADYTCLSAASDTVCAEIEPIPCNVPLALEAANDGESIFLTWNKPVGVEYFRILRDDNAVEEVLYDVNFIDANVVPDVTYCYTIFAYFVDDICNEIVGTACSKIVSGECAESPVLQIEAVGYSVHLNWTVTSDSYTYKIFRNGVAIGMTTDTTYFDNVNPGYNYCYKVESLCEYGMFTRSNEECVFVNEEGDDVIGEWSEDGMSVYPNPTYGQFFIEGQHIATVQIFNAIGQLVAEIENTEDERITVNCDDWNPGLYSVRIVSTEGETATRKVTIFK